MTTVVGGAPVRGGKTLCIAMSQCLLHEWARPTPVISREITVRHFQRDEGGWRISLHKIGTHEKRAIPVHKENVSLGSAVPAMVILEEFAEILQIAIGDYDRVSIPLLPQSPRRQSSDLWCILFSEEERWALVFCLRVWNRIEGGTNRDSDIAAG